MESRFIQLKEDLVTLSKLSNDVFNILDNQTLQFLLTTFPETLEDETCVENVYSMVIFEDILDFSALMIKGLLRVRRDLRRQKQAINLSPYDPGKSRLSQYRPLLGDHPNTCEENIPFARIPLGGEEEIICVQPKECLVSYDSCVDTISTVAVETRLEKNTENVDVNLPQEVTHVIREVGDSNQGNVDQITISETRQCIPIMKAEESEKIPSAAFESDPKSLCRKGSNPSHGSKDRIQTIVCRGQTEGYDSSLSTDKGQESSEDAEEFCCGDCGKAFSHHGSLIRHTYSSHSTQISSLYKCKHCRKLFTSFDHYQEHECKSKGKRLSSTQVTDELEDSLPASEGTNDGKRSKPADPENFVKETHIDFPAPVARQTGLSSHETLSEPLSEDEIGVITTSGLNDSKKLVCPRCKGLFHSTRDLEMHSCGSDIDRKNLIEHLDRPNFSRYSELRPSLATINDQTGDAALQANSKARARVCKLCGGYFATYSALIDHRHIHIREYPFQCSSCEKAYKTGGELKRHQHVHTGERPYGCEFCGRYFALSHHLKRHVQTHLES